MKLFFYKVTQTCFAALSSPYTLINTTALYQLIKTLRTFKVALNPLQQFFLNFAKSYILAYWSHFNNKKWGSASLFLSYRYLKLKLGVFLTGYTVATVTGYVNKMFITCLPMFGHSFGTIIIVSTDKVW